MSPTVMYRLKILVNVYQKQPRTEVDECMKTKYVIIQLYNMRRYDNSKLSITYL